MLLVDSKHALKSLFVAGNLAALSEAFTSVQPSFGSRNLKQDVKPRAKLTLDQAESIIIGAPKEEGTATEFGFDQVIESPGASEVKIEVTDGVDAGKEIILSNLDPANWQAELRTSDFRVDKLSEGFDSGIGEMVESSVPELQPLDALVEENDPGMSETVSAILAASEEAVAAAEASFPEVVAEELVSPTEESDSPLLPQAEPADPVVPPIEILPASTVVGEPQTSQKITAPTVSKILSFAIPAIGVWLCGPILSLIDTSTVGLFSSTTQQAALNPAVAVTQYAALLIAFLFTGTTNLIAASRETDRELEGSPKTTNAFIGALQLSAFVGAGLGLVLFTSARFLLRSIIGNDAISPLVFGAAMKYVRIRSLGMPAAAVIGSAQSASLGMQDIRSPLYVLLIAALVNLCGDLVFVGCKHPFIGGAAGAAWATVFSEYVASAVFVRRLCSKPKQPSDKPAVMNLSKAILELTGKPFSAGEGRRKRFLSRLQSVRSKSNEDNTENELTKGGRISSAMRWANKKMLPVRKAQPKQNEGSYSVKGFLNGKFKGRDLVKLPSKETVKEFAPYVVPVTTTQVGRVSGYVAMSHVVSSSMGTVGMAAQQVLVSLFYCLCPIADSLSQTAQSFVPGISEKNPSAERTKALRRTVSNFLKAGGVFGAAMVAAVYCIPLLSHMFTTDPVVVSMVNMVAPLLVGFFAVHGCLCSAEGLLLSQKDLGFLGKMYAAAFVLVPYFMLRVKRAALSSLPGAVNLTSVWKVFLGYQLARFAAWMGRVILLQRRIEREHPEC